MPHRPRGLKSPNRATRAVPQGETGIELRGPALSCGDRSNAGADVNPENQQFFVPQLAQDTVVADAVTPLAAGIGTVQRGVGFAWIVERGEAILHPSADPHRIRGI